jgi:hypothetical protein
MKPGLLPDIKSSGGRPVLYETILILLHADQADTKLNGCPLKYRLIFYP